MKFDYKVAEITKEKAVIFIQKYHYSPVMPKLTKHYLGFFVDNELRGVLTLGWGTQPLQTIRKMFPSLTTQSYFEIGKMCMDDDMPKNSESQMLSATEKWLKIKKPQVMFLYTMADGIMGKCGFVYQASNFWFGEKYWTQVYMMENGEKLHPRSTRPMLEENAKMHGKEKMHWLSSDYMKLKNIKKIEGYMFRYIRPLSKKAKKLLKTGSTLDWSLKYPKMEDLEWKDVTDKNEVQFIDKPPFTFQDAKYNNKNISNGSTSNDLNLEELMVDF
jgi:hypothetical protein